MITERWGDTFQCDHDCDTCTTEQQRRCGTYEADPAFHDDDGDYE